MKIRNFFIILMLVSASSKSFGQVNLVNLRCEYKINPQGIETRTPQLGWEIRTTDRNLTQKAYRVLVSDNESTLVAGKGNVWDSGKITTNESQQIPYDGPRLNAGKYYYWKVTVWDNSGRIWNSAVTAKWQMGLLSDKDWKNAQWIGHEVLPQSDKIVPAIHGLGSKNIPGTGKDVLPLLRKDFKVMDHIKNATLYISGLGQFDASLNGIRIGNHFLDPAWTNYEKEAVYVTFDVTTHLHLGANTIGVMLGNGMFYTPRERYRKFTGAFGYPKMKCLLVLEYQDGHSETVISDNTWQSAPGPITFSSIYGGEDYDARTLQPGWNTPGFSDNSWKRVAIIRDTVPLKSQKAEPIMIMDSFTVKKITQPKPHIWVYDMGQNMAGIPQITVKGRKGNVIRITPGELLGDDGQPSQKGVGSPYYLTYTLSGNGVETWHPQFTYYGFRYLQIEGADPETGGDFPLIIKVQSLHIRNSAEQAGHFYCSNSLFNETFDLINWAVKSNMVSILTDCPTREKLGWLEQDHLMANSIRCNYDVINLFRQETEVIKSAQLPNGMIPDIAPEYTHFDGGFRDSPEWGSTGVILPWYVYQWYGNKSILQDSYGMITGYVDYLTSKANNSLLNYGLGDWFDIGPNKPGKAQLTPIALTATAYYYYDTKILSQIAEVLGKTDDAARYGALAAVIRKAYNDRFFNSETGNYGTGSQTANAISIYMGLTDAEKKPAVLNNLISDIRKNNNAITTGDIGFRYLLKVLADEGRSDIIYEMNSRSDVPGYGFQLSHGATSLTESWQAYKFVSNNHLMLGHLMEWFYNDLAGIRYPDGKAAGSFTIKPSPVGDVTSAHADFNSPYGKITTDWKITGGKFLMTLSVPGNTSATVCFPKNFSREIVVKGLSATDFKTINNPDGTTNYIVGSGLYDFQSSKNR